MRSHTKGKRDQVATNSDVSCAIYECGDILRLVPHMLSMNTHHCSKIAYHACLSGCIAFFLTAHTTEAAGCCRLLPSTGMPTTGLPSAGISCIGGAVAAVWGSASL